MIDLSLGDALTFYERWPTPNLIIADGPYGIKGYRGDLTSAEALADWYEPHVERWSKLSSPATTLWFWNTELGWANVHPVLRKHGWQYRACCIWDKGVGHIAGNVNTQTIRKFPVVTEVCVHYVRQPKFLAGDTSLQDWLRDEWKRTGLPFNRANEACGVKNAATRKYLTPDHHWYFPPWEVFERLSKYANQHGEPAGRPYFALNGKPITRNAWRKIRGTFQCPHGYTNVWSVPPVRGAERVKIGSKAVHPNQKPLELMALVVKASACPCDVVWEPFGGLCTASIAARQHGCRAYCAEIDRATFEAASKRIELVGVEEYGHD
jgi:site-specific DNA-methyltransferase (adenine-specific)